MKQLTCEMCGSTDLVKQDGVFVCQSCGCKYSTEDAKKMMIEGTVNVQGTVKIDMSEKLRNLYQVARRAKDDNDSGTAAKYYDMILVEDPTSWEASFYSVYFRSMSCTIGQIPSAASAISKCLTSVLTLVKQSGITEEETHAAVTEVHEKATSAASTFLLASANSFCNIRTDHPAHFVPDLSTRSFAAVDVAYTIGTAIDNVFGNKAWAQKLVSSAYSTGNSLMSTFVSVMKPRSFLEIAPIHGQMESEANRIIAKYKNKIYEADSKGKQLAAEEDRIAARIAAEEREARVAAYWAEHESEKQMLESELESISNRLAILQKQLDEISKEISPQIAALSQKRTERIPEEIEVDKQRDLIWELERTCAALGIFKGKEKKEITERLNTIERPKLDELKKKREIARERHISNLNAEAARLNEKGSDLRAEAAKLKARQAEINKELTQDRK